MRSAAVHLGFFFYVLPLIFLHTNNIIPMVTYRMLGSTSITMTNSTNNPSLFSKGLEKTSIISCHILIACTKPLDHDC